MGFRKFGKTVACKCGHVQEEHGDKGCRVTGCSCTSFKRAPPRKINTCFGCEHLQEYYCDEIRTGGGKCVKYPYKWDDDEYKRWIDRVRPGSRPSYEKALELWIGFIRDRYGIAHTPKTLIDEIEEDRRKPRREQGVIEDRLVAFFNWLREEYVPKGVFGRGNLRRKKRGVSPKKAMAYIMAIRSFYRRNGFPIRSDDLSTDMTKEPQVSPWNQQHQFTMDELRRMVDACTNLRDKAIIIVKAQSLMDSSTLAYNFRYSTIVRGFRENFKIPARNFLPKLIEALRSTKYPLHIRIERFKTRHIYDTFIGRDGCLALADYLEEKLHTGIKPGLNDVIFTLYKNEMEHPYDMYIKSDTRDVISELFRRLTRKLGIISEAVLESADINPARPHALRGSIATILREYVNSEIVEYWMGHKIKEKSLAYFLDLQARRDKLQEKDRIEKMRELYAKYEHLISFS